MCPHCPFANLLVSFCLLVPPSIEICLQPSPTVIAHVCFPWCLKLHLCMNILVDSWVLQFLIRSHPLGLLTRTRTLFSPAWRSSADPYPKLGFGVETDDPIHTPRGYEKVYNLYNWGWVNRSAFPCRPEMAWESKERRLWARGLGWGEESLRQEGICIVCISHWYQRREHQVFLSAFPDVRQRARWKGWDLRTVSNQTSRNGIRLLPRPIY